MKRFLRFLTIYILFLALAACGGGGGGGDDDGGNGGTTPGESAELMNAATSVETAFLSGDPDALVSAMSDEAKAFYQADMADQQPMLEEYGKLFKNRRLIFASDTYAEYAFDVDGDDMTVAFSRNEDGTWQLMRF